MRMERLESYKDTEAFFNTCKSVKKGKPLPGNWRLHLDSIARHSPSYWIDMGYSRNRLCNILHNDTVQFQITPDVLYRNSHSIVMVLSKVLPIMCERKRQGMYNIGPVGVISRSWGTYLGMDKANACEYFQGLTFDLKTCRIVNPQPDLLDTADPEIYKSWRKDLTRFKRGLKVRAKVGAFTGYVDTFTNTKEYKNNRGWGWDMFNRKLFAEDGTDMSNAENSNAQQYVLECMRTEQYPADLLRAFVLWAIKHNVYSRSQLDNQSVLKYVDQMFNKHSLDYRKAYGVFGKEKEKLDTAVK